MPKLTPEQFAQIVKAVADGGRAVKNVTVGDYTVVADILTKSGKGVIQWSFMFDKVTGSYKYYGPIASANAPRFFGDAIRQAIKSITGA